MVLVGSVHNMRIIIKRRLIRSKQSHKCVSVSLEGFKSKQESHGRLGFVGVLWLVLVVDLHLTPENK